MSISVSAIIPVFNTEKYLRRCVESVLAQTFTDFEMILVDDGSLDGCPQICDEYAEKDPRVRVIHKENGGVSSARNAALDIAEGEYVVFVDSDDFVSEDYLCRLFNAFRENDADVVFMGYNRLEDDTNTVLERTPPDIKGNLLEDIMNLSRNDMFGYTCIKAVRKDFIGETRFREDLDLFEDEVFTCTLFLKEGKIARVNKPIYNYVRGKESLACKTRQDYYRYCEAVYDVWKRLLSPDKEEHRVFLREKANRMTRVCGFYGLEKRLNPVSFLRNLMECDFVKESDLDDGFSKALKDGKLLKVMCFYMVYKTKVYIKNCVVKR